MAKESFWRQALWTAAAAVPVAAGAYSVHSPAAVGAAWISWGVLAGIVPFLFFVFQKQGYGIEYGGKRSAVHLIWWICFMIFTAGLSPWLLTADDLGWARAGRWGMTALFVVLAAAVTVLLIAADYVTVHLWQAVRKRCSPFVTDTAVLAFFTGMAPLFLLVPFVSAEMYFFGSMDAVPFFISRWMTAALEVKMVLAMASIPLYLYGVGRGSGWRRALEAVFTALFWLILAYVPLMVSLRIPGDGAWRTYADPAYLSVIPILSDLWLAAGALRASRLVTGWIFSSVGERGPEEKQENCSRR